MGLRSSKIKPAETFNLLDELTKLVQQQTTFYNEAFEYGCFNTIKFAQQQQIEKSFKTLQEKCSKMVHMDAKKEYMRQCNRMLNKFMQNQIKFKRKLHSSMIQKDIIIHDSLIFDHQFRDFFTLLPNEHDEFALKDKHLRDNEAMIKQLTGESMDSIPERIKCPKCKATFVRTHAKSINAEENA
jgi:hypothetical protein